MFHRSHCPNAHSTRSDVEALFARYHGKLRGRVAAVVGTSEDNVEDACMHAWVQLLRYEIDQRPEHASWLTTVAIREAVKLDRDDRHVLALIGPLAGAVAERPDPRDQFAARDQLADAAAVIQEAGLTARQLQMLSLQLWGLSYARIAVTTGTTVRIVERQVLRAHAKIAEILERDRG